MLLYVGLFDLLPPAPAPFSPPSSYFRCLHRGATAAAVPSPPGSFATVFPFLEAAASSLFPPAIPVPTEPRSERRRRGEGGCLETGPPPPPKQSERRGRVPRADRGGGARRREGKGGIRRHQERFGPSHSEMSKRPYILKRYYSLKCGEFLPLPPPLKRRREKGKWVPPPLPSPLSPLLLLLASHPSQPSFLSLSLSLLPHLSP